MDGGGKLYNLLLDRCHSLEASHGNLQEQLNALMHKKEVRNSKNEDTTSYSSQMMPYSGQTQVPGVFFDGSPHRKVLDQLGHAVHVSRPGPGEIIFWNAAAEKLYGYKDSEVLGLQVWDLLIHEEHQDSAKRIREKLKRDQLWSGQFPYKKRCGRMFMALVTKSLLYEDGELVGIITVSSDASIFNKLNSDKMKIHQDPIRRSRFTDINENRIVWEPEVGTSPSLDVRLKECVEKHAVTIKEFTEHEEFTENEKVEKLPREQAARSRFVLPFKKGKAKVDDESSVTDKSTYDFPKPSNIVEKVFSKLNIGGIGISNFGKDKGGPTQQKNYFEMSVIKDATSSTTPYNTDVAQNIKKKDLDKWVPKILEIEDNDLKEVTTTVGNVSSLSLLKYESKIRWEDITLRETIGEGAYGVVYRGLWNGSDVAVKVFHRNDGDPNHVETFNDFKKEIDIMRRLRHPNVLLFMGGVYSDEKLAVLTEYMPRGSLFRALHKSTQPIDMKRRLLMALDVARGMNYLHHRKPPIVHRDLKSSNLLVDKSWNVKVGDFGLSRLKHATFLSTRSGKGTPQWMAPEVLRSELSTEKSDVYSYGVILWELMTKSVPWSEINSLQVVGLVGFMNRRLDIPERVDPKVASIIQDCWLSASEYRPSFEELIRRLTDIIQTISGVTVRKIKGPSN